MRELPGDLTTFTPCDVIVQQLNCVTTRTAGLASVIARKLGHNPYAARRPDPTEPGVAVEADCAEPGTIDLAALDDGRHICGLFAQYAPGPPGSRSPRYRAAVARAAVDDDAAQRTAWFAAALQSLGEVMRERGWRTAAFPFAIGCGLAGGDWSVYSAIISDWESRTGVDVVIVRLPENGSSK
jgi:O-acetyl-ADP-ribose deacetylase (regulator of RNase III)